MNNIFLKKYFSHYQKLINFDDKTITKLVNLKKKIIKNKKNTLYIFGNGGSSAIANHFAIDMTKNAKIKTMTFSDSSHITCLSNDFGFENWISKTIEYYVEKNDMIIFVSCSGNSKNLVNGARTAKKIGCKEIISLTGCKKNNNLKKLSNTSFWVNSKSYNLIENTHQLLLLSLVDLIIGKIEYSPN